ncbi:ABC transporter substrate-binding protein [Octadecabacter sp.]|nr:ABC transporter substrate-binding protein [Octadecabacter sp.]
MYGISRRGLLQSGVAAGVLAATGLPLKAQTRGGKLTAGLSGANTSDTWDARTHTDLFMIASAQGAVFDSLTEVAADGSLVGELAESWGSADAKTWTFILRQGVTFHNGKSFGADDVIASLQMHLGEESKSAAKPIVSAIETMTKVTDHQVQFVLASANADFPYLMSDYHILMYPAGQIDEAIANGIGTGLYQVTSFDPGVRMTASRYIDHYKGDSAGFFDEIEYIAINDNIARMNALMTGQVDTINRIDLKTESLLRANPALRIQEVTGNQHYTMPMLTNVAPYNDINVRKALKYGINRQELVDKILLGHGAVGNDTPIGPANQYYHAEMEQLEYDPDQAKFYLQKAGFDSIDIDFSASNAAFEGAVDAGQLFQASAAASGININVIQEPADGYWDNVWRVKPFSACYYSGRATEDWMFSLAYQEGAPWNDTQWDSDDSARFQQLLLLARAEMDSDTRQAQYFEMQEILRDEGGVLVPMFANYVQAVNNRISSPDTVGNLWQMDNGRMAERWSVA